MISNIMMNLKNIEVLEEGLVRHMVLNSLRSYNRMFRSKYGNLIICCDNHSIPYWRKSIFPFYKAHRKTDRDASPHDWKLIFEIFDTLKAELKQHFPYVVIDIPGIEADDIIATLVRQDFPPEAGNKLIISSDKDFLQLQKFNNVDQYSPILGKRVKCQDPEEFLKEHIIRGDRGDGIPNFLSLDSTFVSGGRQKPINSKKLQKWLRQDIDQICETEEQKRNYLRNKKLIDLSEIPTEISDQILIEFHKEKPTVTKTEMLNYFISKRLKLLIEHLDEF